MNHQTAMTITERKNALVARNKSLAMAGRCITATLNEEQRLGVLTPERRAELEACRVILMRASSDYLTAARLCAQNKR